MKLQLGINKCSNREYHADRSFLSSSQLKTLLKSPAQFKDELDNGKPQTESPYLQEGSLTHSLILEKHLVLEEYAFFDGLRKQGPEWEKFKEENKGKVLMSRPQHDRCAAYERAFAAQSKAKQLIEKGEAEFTICAELLGVPVKCRADWINVEAGYIMDVKTSSFSVEHESFKLTCNQYRYDLSGALYTWIAELYYGKKFDFYFAAISKSDLDCEVYKLGEQSTMRGRSDIIKALTNYKCCAESGNWPIQIEKRAAAEDDDQILEV